MGLFAKSLKPKKIYIFRYLKKSGWPKLPVKKSVSFQNSSNPNSNPSLSSINQNLNQPIITKKQHWSFEKDFK